MPRSAGTTTRPHEGQQGASPLTLEPHQHLWSHANEFAALGRNCDELIRAVERGELAGSASIVGERPDRTRLHRWVRRVWRKASARQSSFAEVAAHLDAYPWPSPRHRATDEVVVYALLKIAKDSGEPPMPEGSSRFVFTVTASHRRVMNTAALGSNSTLPAALQRLEAQGIVSTSTLPDTLGLRQGTEFTVTIPKSPLVSEIPCSDATPAWGGVAPHTSNAIISDIGLLEHRLHIVWSRQGLGGNARRVWYQLHECGSKTVADLVQDLGLSQGTIRSALARLTDHGLVIRSGTEYSSADSGFAVLDAIARHLNLDSWRARQAEGFEAARQKYDAYRLGFLSNREAWAEARRLCPLMGAYRPACDVPVSIGFTWALAA